jgi:hypothetical protein
MPPGCFRRRRVGQRDVRRSPGRCRCRRLSAAVPANTANPVARVRIHRLATKTPAPGVAARHTDRPPGSQRGNRTALSALRGHDTTVHRTNRSNGPGSSSSIRPNRVSRNSFSTREATASRRVRMCVSARVESCTVRSTLRGQSSPDANAVEYGLISDVVDGVYAARRTSGHAQACWTPTPGETMIAAPELTTITADNVTASRCGHRTSRTLRSPVIDQRSRDERRARPALRRLGRSEI